MGNEKEQGSEEKGIFPIIIKKFLFIERRQVCPLGKWQIINLKVETQIRQKCLILIGQVN